MDAEFNWLVTTYTPGIAVDTVNGAICPLFYATVAVAGTPMQALVDPGLSATIMSFEPFKTVGTKAVIPREALKEPEVTL